MTAIHENACSDALREEACRNNNQVHSDAIREEARWDAKEVC